MRPSTHEVAIRIRAFRKQRLRLNQHQLASLIGVTQKTICAWECGKVAPSQTWLRHLAELAERRDLLEDQLYFAASSSLS